MANLSDNADENYEQFLEDAVDSGIVWAVVTEEGEDGDFALCDSEEKPGTDVMPFFSQQKYVEAVCTGEWSGYAAQPIELDDFIDNWLPGMQKDGLLVGVNWNAELEGLEVEPLDLSLDLLETD